MFHPSHKSKGQTGEDRAHQKGGDARRDEQHGEPGTTKSCCNLSVVKSKYQQNKFGTEWIQQLKFTFQKHLSKLSWHFHECFSK